MSRHLGTEEIPECDCKFACFFSHAQLEASSQCQILKLQIEPKLKEKKTLWEVWMDKTQRATRKGMHDGVLHSRHFLLFLTPTTLNRLWCRQEIQWALQYSLLAQLLDGVVPS